MRFHTQDNIGAVKYTVSFHDGVKTHGDGSPLFDMRTFTNKKKRDAFLKELRGRKPPIKCVKCGRSQFVTPSLPRDCHTHICSNHEQDLFFTPPK